MAGGARVLSCGTAWCGARGWTAMASQGGYSHAALAHSHSYLSIAQTAVRHPNVLQLHAWHLGTDHTYLWLELAGPGDLFDIVVERAFTVRAGACGDLSPRPVRVARVVVGSGLVHRSGRGRVRSGLE